MGAWGPGHFDNDDARDWLWTLEGDTDAQALRGALFPVATGQPTGEPPEVEASIALAAAAVVAKSRGVSVDALPDEAEEWIRRRSALVDDELVDAARRSVNRVSFALSDEPDMVDWLAAVERLAAELNRA